MAKHIQVTVPQPCRENWNDMTPAEKGRFCKACQKQVVDFTRMSDAQLAAFFKKPSTGSVCGRFMNDQLNRDMEIPKKRIPWVRYFFQFAIPAFLASKAAAQEPAKLMGDTVIMASRTQPGETAPFQGKGTERVIKGRIVDEEGNGIDNAIVQVNNTGIGVVTNSQGFFQLVYPGPAKKIILTVSRVGFTEKTKVVRLGKKMQHIPAIELVLVPAMQGAVVIVGEYAAVSGYRPAGKTML